MSGQAEMQRPRKKRRMRTAAIVVLLVLLLGAFWFCTMAVRVAMAPPGREGRYVNEMAKLLAPLSDGEGANAREVVGEAMKIRGAAEAKVWGPTGKRKYEPMYDALYSPHREPGATAEDEAMNRKLAEEGVDEAMAMGLAGAMERMAAAPRVEREIPQGRIVDTLLPELGQMRQVARLNAGRMRLAALRGDHADRAAAFEQMLALGRVAASDFMLISHLVGVAIDSMACMRLREDLTARPMPAEQLERALQALDKQPLPPLALAFAGERLMVLDALEWCHSDDGHGDGVFQPGALSAASIGTDPFGNLPRPLSNLAGWGFASKKQSRLRVDEYYAGVTAAAGAARHERKAVFDGAAWIERLSKRYFVVSLLLPATDKCLQSRDQVDLEIAATKTMLAIELFKARSGALPTSLADLTPGILARPLVDAVSGKPLGYKRLAPGEDPAGREYLLYSCGDDGVDDGGQESPTADAYLSLQPGKGKRFDYVLNRVCELDRPAEKK